MRALHVPSHGSNCVTVRRMRPTLRVCPTKLDGRPWYSFAASCTADVGSALYPLSLEET